MKREVLVFLVLTITLILAIDVYVQDAKVYATSDYLFDADNMGFERTPLNKLGRGIINTLTCLVEIPAQAYEVSEEKDPLVGCTLGVAEGFFTALCRGMTGLFDVVTFIIPPYNKPLMKPEYAVESAIEKFQEHNN